MMGNALGCKLPFHVHMNIILHINGAWVNASITAAT